MMKRGLAVFFMLAMVLQLAGCAPLWFAGGAATGAVVEHERHT